MSEYGEQIGIVSLAEAKRRATEAGLDLAEIAPDAKPPVVKILDWGKFRYEQTKQQAKGKKKQKSIEVKQIRLSLKIGEHDLDVKLRRAQKFLEDGHKVKVGLLFKGREITHPDLGHKMIDKFAARLEDLGQLEQSPQMSGRELSIVLGVKKNAKTQNS